MLVAFNMLMGSSAPLMASAESVAEGSQQIAAAAVDPANAVIAAVMMALVGVAAFFVRHKFM